MLRTLILTFFGGLIATAPLTAQECTSCPGCESATVATTASQDEPTALAKGLAALAKKPFKFGSVKKKAKGSAKMKSAKLGGKKTGMKKASLRKKK